MQALFLQMLTYVKDSRQKRKKRDKLKYNSIGKEECLNHL